MINKQKCTFCGTGLTPPYIKLPNIVLSKNTWAGVTAIANPVLCSPRCERRFMALWEALDGIGCFLRWAAQL